MEKIFYRVRSGDTVESIAEKFFTSPSLIIFSNRLMSEIKEGDVLFIPRGKIVYKVRLFDTLETLSAKFGVSEKRILELNRVPYIYVGQNLIIE